MLTLLVNWLLSAVSLIIVAHVIRGFDVTSFGTALIAAMVIGLVNATVGLFLKIVTFPLTLVTLGIFWCDCTQRCEFVSKAGHEPPHVAAAELLERLTHCPRPMGMKISDKTNFDSRCLFSNDPSSN